MRMASANECAEATRVLLVDPQSLPVLLQEDPEANANEISVDLLQQALQGTSAIEDGDDEGESAEEVSLDALSGGNNDVLAIYQGEGGQTHTIKLSLAQALGINFSAENFHESLNNDSMVGGVKVASVGNQLTGNGSDALGNTSLLQSVTCSNVPTEGRMIDEEGNIVETSQSLQILPASLTSLLADSMNQPLSIIPQYQPDGSVTLQIKDQNDAVLGTDYHVLEPDSSAKTGLDIEEELKNSALKQNILHASRTISADSIGLSGSVALTTDSNATSSAIQVPISTLEALSNQMLLPVSNSSVPISVTLSIPTETSVPSNPPTISSSNIISTNAGRFFRIVTDHNSGGLNNIITSDSSPSVPLSTIISQPTLAVAQQQAQLINPTTMLGVQNSSALTLLSSNRGIAQTVPMKQTLTADKIPILPAPKNFQGAALKATTALKKVPIAACAIAPAPIVTTSVHSPAMASVAPNTTQPSLGGTTLTKSALTNGRTSSNSNSLKPLGSSENPIQLVQQGQTFHSMQALSQAQLRQIATVLQQKHLNSSSSSVTTKNVLFDEQTKTRIVYRVVYPEDVDLQQPSSPTDASGSSMGQNATKVKGRPGRRKKVKKITADSEKPMQNIEQMPDSLGLLSNDVKRDLREDNGSHEEIPKVEKKKTLASRTRSGRVSRPPKHMMKDFKRLHHTDYKEKDEDGDGGYSDYSNPDQPAEKPPIKEVKLVPVRKKVSRFSCPTCNKLYLGLSRMQKHFQQHPDHGSFEEFKQKLTASVPVESNTSEAGEKETETSLKTSVMKGRKRNPSTNQSEKERSEIRKLNLKQALEACEISEVMEVAGPLIARYYSLYDLLLLRLAARDGSNAQKDSTAEGTQHHETQIDGNNEDNFNSSILNSVEKTVFSVDCSSINNQSFRSTANRVQWLLMELNSLTDTLQSLAGDLFKPPNMHSNERSHIEISEKTVSNLLGVSCGLYSVDEEQLIKSMESVTSGLRCKVAEDLEGVSVKRPRTLDGAENLGMSLNHEGSELCPDNLSSLSLMDKPVDDEKAMLAKLTEDMPFLNSSDDMICSSEDPDLSTDGKRDQDCDPVAGLQVVDDIVNERLKNLSENLNFSVPLQGGLETSVMNGEPSNLHLISSFGGAHASLSVNNSSVIPNSLTENKPSGSVSSMDLMSSYSMSSLSRPGAHDVNISNPEASNDLASALEPVSSQSMLGSFEMGLSSLTSFDTLQSQSSTVPHSEDSFLESLSSFETPLTQSCSSSNPPETFGASVMKSNAMLQLASEPTEPSRLPPKFISTFTPAITNDKSTGSISTAQRLQRSYLELDDGLDLDFEAFT